MAKAFRLKVTAEGVEYPQQLSLLEELSCDLAQGFLLSRPASIDDACALTKKLIQRNS